MANEESLTGAAALGMGAVQDEAASAQTASAHKDSVDSDINRRLQRVRTLFALSQRELAKRAGVTNSTISLIEQGKVSPSICSLQKIVSGLPMSLADFFALDIDDDSDYLYCLASQPNLSVIEGVECRILASDQCRRAVTMAQLKLAPGQMTHTEQLFPQAHAALAGINELAGVLISGQLRVIVAGVVRNLVAGDGYYFDTRKSHCFTNTGSEVCIFIAAHSAAANVTQVNN